MKPAVIGVLAFGMSSAAAAGFVAIRSSGSSPAEIQESSRDTSAATVTARADTALPSGTADTVVQNTAVNPDTSAEGDGDGRAAESPVATTLADCPALEPPDHPQPAAPPEPTGPDPELQRQAYRQVARILSNMRDKDVAQVLAHIEDDEVEIILRNVTAREAARILSQLPGERAARLSRRLLRAAESEGSNDT